MSVADPTLLDRCARACHAAYCAERASGKLHAPEECPCRDGRAIVAKHRENEK